MLSLWDRARLQLLLQALRGLLLRMPPHPERQVWLGRLRLCEVVHLLITRIIELLLHRKLLDLVRRLELPRVHKLASRVCVSLGLLLLLRMVGWWLDLLQELRRVVLLYLLLLNELGSLTSKWLCLSLSYRILILNI